MNSLVKGLYIIFGIFALILGGIGAALPILPTTPFLLLSLYCFAKGSERWHKWFIKTKLYKKYLDDFVEKRAMTMKQKVAILLFADFMLMFPLILIDNILIKMTILLLMLTKYYYFIYRIKTITDDDNKVI